MEEKPKKEKSLFFRICASMTIPQKIMILTSGTNIYPLLDKSKKTVLTNLFALTRKKLERKNYIPFFTSFLTPTSFFSTTNFLLHLQMTSTIINSVEKGKKGILVNNKKLGKIADFGLFLAGYGASWYLKTLLCNYGETDEGLLEYTGTGGCYALITYFCSKHHCCIKFGNSYFPGYYLPFGAFLVGGVYNLRKYFSLNIDEFLSCDSWKLYVGNMAGAFVGFICYLVISPFE